MTSSTKSNEKLNFTFEPLFFGFHNIICYLHVTTHADQNEIAILALLVVVVATRRLRLARRRLLFAMLTDAHQNRLFIRGLLLLLLGQRGPLLVAEQLEARRARLFVDDLALDDNPIGIGIALRQLVGSLERLSNVVPHGRS